ncbi:MAG: putative toxin-antitoxin system toxin component, PIN family [Gammaproteobacteria bacterium]|nr:putative toxin-antitoxin system toxin component, PIN family [Gammaproteobacteria bacterium]
MQAFIVDTNVVVAGLITNDGESPVAQILDGMLVGSIIYLLSPDLLFEYRAVLSRPRIKIIHKLSDNEIDELLTELIANAVWREPSAKVTAPDPGDNHLWSLLAYQPNTTLVTGDKLLLNNPPDFAQVLSAAEVLKI